MIYNIDLWPSAKSHGWKSACFNLGNFFLPEVTLGRAQQTLGELGENMLTQNLQTNMAVGRTYRVP